MALINKIRERTGLAVGVIAFGLILFLVGGDLLGPNSRLFGDDRTVMGEIAGEEIKHEDFIARVDQYSNNYAASTGRNPSSDDLSRIRESVWASLVRQITYTKELDELGMAISTKELEEMVKGDNISPLIRQNFTNPQTGEFSKENVIKFLQGYNDLPPQQRAAWNELEEQIKQERLISKFQNLLLKTNYATKAEAKEDYIQKNSSASVSYLYIPYFSVPDSLVKVTDDELRKYIKANPDDYQVDETRDISYVSFDVKPSSEDTASVKTEVERLIEAFVRAENDSLYARRNSDNDQTYYVEQRLEELPEEVKLENEVQVGQVFGPVLKGGKFVLYKVSGEGEKYNAKANHILIKPADESETAKADAQKEARRILREIRNGADFAEMASQYGTDGTKNSGGDLGWFVEGAMVGPFNDAVMNATKTGLLKDVVETDFGYHVVEVTETKVKGYKLAQVEIEIYPSDETINEVYRKADIFATDNNTYEKFKATAETEGLAIQDRKRIGKNEKRLGSIANARGIVQWAFLNAGTGDVSEVYDIDSKYVVAAITGEQEEGTANVEAVRNEVERKVINDKKGELIVSKLGDISGSLEDIAEAYGTEAQVHNMSDLKLSSNSLNSVGSAADVVGLSFALNEGERTNAIASDNGVIILQLDGISNATEIEDYSFVKDQVEQTRQNRISQGIQNAIEENADIKDNRYRFF